MRQVLEEQRPVSRHRSAVSISPARAVARGETCPTALPRRNIQVQRTRNEFEKLAPRPNTAVRKRVELNGKARPIRSEIVPQPMAPTIICARFSRESSSGQNGTHARHGSCREKPDDLGRQAEVDLYPRQDHG